MLVKRKLTSRLHIKNSDPCSTILSAINSSVYKVLGQTALNKFYHIPRKSIFASNNLWLSVSDTLDRSTNKVTTLLPLSRAYFKFSVIFNKAFGVLRFLRNPANSGKNLDSIKRFI